MNILFLHNNFPAQFLHLAKFYSENPLFNEKNKVVFLSLYKRGDLHLPGVTLKKVQPLPEIHGKSNAENALRQHFYAGQFYAAAMVELLKDGFAPDLIYDHPGWGCSAYVNDIFPHVPRISYFEWFYTKGANYDFFSRGRTRAPAEFAASRQRNLCQYDALRECDIAISPTAWQFRQYPPEYSHKFRILHDGIDTAFFSPADMELEQETVREGGEQGGRENQESAHVVQGLDLSAMGEIVTYTARGLEPYRGFPQFYKSIPYILQARPDAHIVIMAGEDVHYGEKRKDGKTWKQAMLDELPVDETRVHFLAHGSYPEYRKLLRHSGAHVYLTVPFVLSWSMLEAMSCGCLVVASATEPVREVIEHAKNGLLTSFWDEKEIAKVVSFALENREKLQAVRAAARKTILERYAIAKCLQQHVTLATDLLVRNRVFNFYMAQQRNQQPA